MRVKLNDLPKQYRDQIANTATNMEQNISHAPLPEKTVKRLDTRVVHPFTKPVRIHYHSRRIRIADIDGLCSKYFTDGIVLGKILQDDSAEFVKEVTNSQEKADAEETIIIIKEV